MSVVPYLAFAGLALAAILFATFALWRGWERRKALLAGAIALFLLGVGGGTYWMVGDPGLALRSAQGLNVRDARGLIPILIERVRKAPTDWQAWIYLGRAYIAANDIDDAMKAYGRGVSLMRVVRQPDAAEEATYGQLLVAANNGQVSDQAEIAFANALKQNPRDPAARFYLGEAHAERGNKQAALDLWQGLLADVPENAPLHQMLVDRIALLTAQTLPSGGTMPGGGAPDPRAMVAGLAARLAQSPDDPAGWQRLIKAYTVLGETDKAKQALATARKTFASRSDVMSALSSEAAELKLQ